MAPHTGSRSASTTPQSHISNPRTPASSSKQRPVSLLSRFPPPLPFLPTTTSSDHPVEAVARVRDHPEGFDKPSVLQVLQSGPTVRVRTEQGYREFGLDGVSTADNEDLESFYKKYVERRIESVKSGGRCTIMMYGPTGAGKSHTMFGSAKEPGIAYRAIQNILGESNVGSEDVNDKLVQGSPVHYVKKRRISVSILEIYNEEIFDLLAGCANTQNGHWTRPHMTRVRLEIMGKKAKNAVSISGYDAEKISREIAKVEKRRVVKSTFCNDRSSRSHCLVMLDVPENGGRLVLVDMAGSENLEQAGLGVDTKMQTGKINQGNVALKRVVEAIANSDGYIPFRDSKLTMLLQDSFEDDGAKILMILCASPDPKDMHKTIATLEYGCKAKCIVSLPASPAKEKLNSSEKTDLSVLEARLRAMDAYISKLEAQNKSKDREKESTIQTLMHKEEELIALKKAMEQLEQKSKDTSCKLYNEDVITEMERRLMDCQKVAEELVMLGKKKLEDKVVEQRREIEHMQSRMKEIEKEVELWLTTIPAISEGGERSPHKTGAGKIWKTKTHLQETFDATTTKGSTKRQVESCDNDELSSKPVVLKKMRGSDNEAQTCHTYTEDFNSEGTTGDNALRREIHGPNAWLPSIPEESDREEDMMADDDDYDMDEDGSVDLTVCGTSQAGEHACPQSNDGFIALHHVHMDSQYPSTGSANSLLVNIPLYYKEGPPNSQADDGIPISAVSRRSRIENIFLLCGNHRELAAAAHVQKPPSSEAVVEPVWNHSKTSEQGMEATVLFDYNADAEKANPHELGITASPSTPSLASCAITSTNDSASKAMKLVNGSPVHPLSFQSRQPFIDNSPPTSTYPSPLSAYSFTPTSKSIHNDSLFSGSEGPGENVPPEQCGCEVFVKWETSKDSSGKLVDTIRLKRNATLAELRKEVEKRVLGVKNDFTFLMLGGDPGGAPVEREREGHLSVMSLPDCHRQRGTKLACLRPHVKGHGAVAATLQGPLSSVENQMTWKTCNSKHAAAPSPDLSLPFRHNENAGNMSYSREQAKAPACQRLSFPTLSHVKGLRL